MSDPLQVQALTPPTAERLLAVVDAVIRELRSSALGSLPLVPATLESSLDRDLGLDSLARAELVSRIEHEFGVRLPEEVFASAEQPADLLQAILQAQGGSRHELAAARAGDAVATGLSVAIPTDASTLAAVLTWYGTRHPDRTHLRFFEDDSDGAALTYGGLLAEGTAVAAGLQTAGIAPGDPVALMLPTSRAYFIAFAGALLAGAIVVPIYPPARATRLEEHIGRCAGILENAGARTLLVQGDTKPVANLLQARVPSLRQVATTDDLAATDGRFIAPSLTAADVALLQYTSGSTGAPKGVTLSHGNLLANIRAMAEMLAVGPQDVFVSWLPLYHDMGLIGAWLGSLHQATPLVAMSPMAFLGRPLRWLKALDRYRGTVSGGPNFAYELLLRHVSDAELAALDLSSWRVAFNGAEPVNAATVERFCKRFATAGFRRETMMPVYGLAENCVGLTFPPLRRAPLIIDIDRDALANTGRVEPAVRSVSVTADPRTAAPPLRLVGCGEPLPGHEIRIVNAAGFEVPERQEGAVQFRGPSASEGYWHNPHATAEFRQGEWRNSGDLGFVADGNLFITARLKDLIIRAGRNIHPADVEDAVSRLPGVYAGRAVAFGDADPASGSERLLILVETRRREPEAQDELRRTISRAVTDLLGSPTDEVILAPPNSIPRTSSGKVRRQAARSLWRQGQIGSPPPPRWRQLLQLAVSGVRGRLRRFTLSAGGLLFACRAWTVAAILGPIAWLAAALLPRLSWRWAACHRIARLLFGAAGLPLSVHGLHNVPTQPCVLAANHASYLDVFALVAALSRPVAFVAKAELTGAWTTRVLLRQMGTLFVERFDRKQGLADWRRIATAARNGHSPLFFPEGTFRRIPGLLPFRMGAFACAIEAALPVVPVAIRGTRSILPGESRLPRPGGIHVEVLPAIAPEVGSDNHTGAAWAIAVILRDRVRAAILARCGEPDARASNPFAQIPVPPQTS